MGSDRDRIGIGWDRIDRTGSADPQASWKCALDFTYSSILRLEVVLESLIEVWMVSLYSKTKKKKRHCLFVVPL